MAGRIICVLIAAVSVLALLWLKAKGKEKNKQDAAKVMALAGVLGFAIYMTENGGQRLTEDGRLLKNEAGEDSDSQKLQLNVDGILEDYDYTVEVEAQRVQGNALEQLFDYAAKEAEELFIAGNVSLDYITERVSLPKKLQSGQIQAGWHFSPEGIIDEEGNLWTEKLDETGIIVMVSLTMDYYGETRNHLFGCRVYKKKLNSAEQLLADIKNYFEKETEKSRNEEYIRLPIQLNGRVLQWSQAEGKTYQIILLLGLFGAIAVYIQQGLQEQQKEQKRKELLLRQYPDMVSKLSLLLGAGMTLSGAWERIVLNYQRQLERRQTEQVEVYEEMMISYRELQDGIGELKVYERFGERCGTPQYRKLAMLIIQNLRKGSAGLMQILEKEVTEAFALRKNHAKKAGEEAGTKILLPMVMMLCIVMVIILVPAFLTFQM